MTRGSTQDATGSALAPTIGLRCGDAAWGDLARRRVRGEGGKAPMNNFSHWPRNATVPHADKIPPLDAYSTDPWAHDFPCGRHAISPGSHSRNNQTSETSRSIIERANHATWRQTTGRRPPAQSRELHARNTRPDAAGIPQACGEEPGGVACIADPGSEGNPALHPREEAGPPVAERSQGGKGHANNPSVPMKTVRYPDFNRLPSNFRPKSYPQARYD